MFDGDGVLPQFHGFYTQIEGFSFPCLILHLVTRLIMHRKKEVVDSYKPKHKDKHVSDGVLWVWKCLGHFVGPTFSVQGY